MKSDCEYLNGPSIFTEVEHSVTIMSTQKRAWFSDNKWSSMETVLILQIIHSRWSMVNVQWMSAT